MAKRDRRSRALLRGLRKQARKGSLTSRERDLLLDQEKKFRKARRRSAPAVGAGLAGAAALLGTSAGQQVLENIGGGIRGVRDRALDARLDRRVARADARTKEEIAELERAEAEGDLSRSDSAAARSEELADERAEREEEVQRKREEDEFYKNLYKEGRQDMREARQEMREERRAKRKSDDGFDPYIEAVRNMDGSVAVGPANEEQGIRERRQEEMEERRERREEEREQREEKRLDRRLERRGGFDPRTGEYVDSAKQRAADEEFDREFDESLPDDEVMEIARLYNEGRREEAERLADEVLTPEQQQMERFRNRSAVQALRGERSVLPMDASDYRGGFPTTGQIREFSSEDLERQDGPRVRAEGGTVKYARGGVSPMVNDLRRKIARKYGIK